jgi:hypothetical protein
MNQTIKEREAQLLAVPHEPALDRLLYHEALDVIEGRESVAMQRLYAAKRTIEQHLADTTDTEEEATSYYYLLRIRLAERLMHENHQLRELFTKMIQAFHATEATYRREWRAAQSTPERQMIERQLSAFYQLVDGYLRSLELLYEDKGLQPAAERTHAERMRFRRRAAYQTGRHLLHIGHLFLEHSSNYGHSFSRWGLTVVLFVALFAGLYALLDWSSPEPLLAYRTITHGAFDYFYFSLVTFTTLGFGDVTPLAITAKILAGVEGVVGYIMLGVFITLIQRRI